MKKSVFILAIICFLALPFTSAAAAATTLSPSTWLDTTQVNNGIVGVSYTAPSNTIIRLLIVKDGTTYTYKLNAAGATEYFPLQLGNGSYTIALMQNVSGTKYKQLGTSSVKLSLSDASSVFLGSVQNINWKSSTSAIAKAKDLTKNKASVQDKIKAIHDYIVKAISYDSKLSVSVPTDYIPNADNTIKAGKGICYDYSSLFAVMARSAGIPTKLVMGTSSYVKGYHAWNQVLVGGKWVTVDATVDAGLGAKGDGSLTKDAAKYAAARFY